MKEHLKSVAACVKLT